MGFAEDPPAKRRIVFVVGSGRSGTSTMAGALQTLGMHVPQPEVAADETNPKGFGEPQWVVDFHTELLQRCNVQVSDSRPSAWYESGKLSTFGPLRMRLHEWLEQQFAEAPELVVKDPRLAWFVGLWRSAALRCDATPSYVTMLRPVTEVVGSKQRYYTTKFGEVQRTAAWVNMMLHTERASRGCGTSPRRPGSTSTSSRSRAATPPTSTSGSTSCGPPTPSCTTRPRRSRRPPRWPRTARGWPRSR